MSFNVSFFAKPFPIYVAHSVLNWLLSRWSFSSVEFFFNNSKIAFAANRAAPFQDRSSNVKRALETSGLIK